MNKPIVWTIAGVDPSGMAGIHADVVTLTNLGVQVAAITTAVTAQNSHAVTEIEALSAEHVAAQCAALDVSLKPNAIKIGMVATPAIIKKLAAFLKVYSGLVVLDPVLLASCGTPLFLSDIKEDLKQLFVSVDVLTPNLMEAEALLNCRITSYAQMQEAALALIDLGAKSVLLKGGHFQDSEFSQDYWTNGRESFWLANCRLPDKNYRGTGCTFSSALTACLALGYDIKDALVIAKMYVNSAIRNAVAIDVNTAQLVRGTWPEDQRDLPYISPNPLKKLPAEFKPCVTGFYPVIDSSDWIEKLALQGVRCIQLRIKNRSGESLEQEIKRAIALAKKYALTLFINDYWELAIAYGADGVHLGQEDIEQADLARIHKAGLYFGISTHCYYEVARAHAYHPSYIACGPIYFTNSKIMSFQPLGIEQLHRWRRTLKYPLVAIGGINAERLSAVMATGVDGIAVISAITKAADPLRCACEFVERINNTGDLIRYSQQIKLAEIGEQGQQKLKNARVLCVGLGGLGSPASLYLAAAGIGTLGIIDDDKLALSNLHRQILYRTCDIEKSKILVAKEQLQALNPGIQINAYPTQLNQHNAVDLVAQYDIIVDGSDNFYTRYLLHDTCYELEKAYVFASVSQFKGYCSLFYGSEGPCMRCLFPKPPTGMSGTCSGDGVLGVVPGMLGIIQATEVIKWILNIGTALHRRLLTIDLFHMHFKEIELVRDPECALCVHHTKLEDLNSCLNTDLKEYAISHEQLAQFLEHRHRIILLDVRSLVEHEAENLGGIVIPLNDLPQRLQELDKSKTVIVYCRSGQRSISAVQILLSAGFSSVHYLLNGITTFAHHNKDYQCIPH